jgi:hypothetical protein
MRKAIYIVCALGLMACSTTNVIPIDDTYYWPENEPKAAKASSTSQASPAEVTAPTAMPINEIAAPAASSIEYLNVQDTTVTIKIKK